MRIYLDLVADSASRAAGVAPDWDRALQECLARAAEPERDAYIAELDEDGGRTRPASAASRRSDDPLIVTTRDDLDATAEPGGLDRLIAGIADRKAQLRPEHLDTLVACAQALARRGDRRLVDALLSHEPISLEAAPLFLEATPNQRAAILVAAQRAVLGRKPTMAVRLDQEAASRLEFAAIAGDARDFAEALANALGADYALAERIGADATGEPLAVALIALGWPRDLAVRIVTARDIQDRDGYRRIRTLARLSEQVSMAAARTLLSAMLGQPALPGETPALAPAAQRQVEHPSPFLRRDGLARKASPETTARSARGSQRP